MNELAKKFGVDIITCVDNENANWLHPGKKVNNGSKVNNDS